MNLKQILLGALLYIVAQALTFWQINGQFIWDSFKTNTLVICLFGIPISYFYILAARYTIFGFNLEMWPSRFIGFAMGMIVFAIGTSYYFDQHITLKTLVSLSLCFIVLLIQVLWKTS